MASKNWNYDDIAIFSCVIDCDGFSAAATKLGLPTSTVSRRVQKLEDAMGLRLLERNSRKLKLTDAGQELWGISADSLQRVRLGVDSMLQQRESESGRIRVTMPVFLGTEIAAAWLREFYLHYPEIVLDIDLNNKYTDLIENGIDLAIRVGPQKDSQYIAQYLCTSRCRLCVSPSFLESSGEITDLQSLKALPFLKLYRNLKLEAVYSNKRESIIHGPIALQANDIAIIREACVQGKGLACLPDFAVREAVKTKQLTVIMPQIKLEPIRDIYAVYPGRRNLARPSRLLIDFFREKFQSLEAEDKEG